MNNFIIKENKTKLLGLDFSLTSAEDRAAAIQKIFEQKGPTWVPTPKEQDLIATYLLYGHDSNGKSPIQNHEIIGVKSVYSKKPPESLDQLVESPVFNEYSISQIGSRTQYKIPKPNLNRDEYREKASPHELNEFTKLWNQIDKINNILELHNSGEKTLPLRKYYQLRHLLVDLRRQQYTLKDNFYPTINQHIQPTVYRGGEIDESILGTWDTIGFLPLGLYNRVNPIWGRQFRERVAAKELHIQPLKYMMDFREKNHIHQLIYFYEDLETNAANDPESASASLLETLQYYIDRAKLPPHQQDILRFKIQHYTNEEIRELINKKYGTKYSVPYISTIFTQQICEDIAAAAQMQWDEYCAKDNDAAWKICSECGRTLLRDERNFARYTRARDGFQGKCKECDKKNRVMRAEKRKQKMAKEDIDNGK